MSLYVLHLIGGGELGGAEQHVLRLLKSSKQVNIRVALACLVKPSPFAAAAVSLGLETSSFPMRFALNLSPVLQVAWFCRRHRVDLIHCHGSRANLVGRLAGKLVGVLCISTVHSLPESDYLSTAKGKRAVFIDNLTLGLSSGIITISKHLYENILLRLEKKGLTIPLQTIYNGVEPLDFSFRHAMRSAFRQQWDINADSIVVGTIGRLHPVKGHVDLIQAATILQKKFPTLHLVIVGEGPLQANLVELLSSSGIPYTLTGFQADAWKALPAFDLFVLPSRSEGMGLVLLEAAQAEVPIVASHVGGIPELFRDKQEALLSPPNDPVALALCCQQLLKNPELSERLVQQAKERALQFSVDQMAEQTAAFYHHLFLTQKPAN